MACTKYDLKGFLVIKLLFIFQYYVQIQTSARNIS